ncbi:MAG: lactate racemase domain-containing protein [Planctomycetaceae bacterium]
MTSYYSNGSATTSLTAEDFRDALRHTFQEIGPRNKVLLLPPDMSRLPSRAGELTVLSRELLGAAVTDIMPALGTHYAMTPEQLDLMFPGVPHDLFRVHRWRDDVVTLGYVPASFVREVTEGIWDRDWPAQVNKLLLEGGHDLIFSIGQVVPHEVIGMANYNKNVFVGTGGVRGINESHFLSAAYGMERVMGQANTPLRKILNYAQDHFCQDMPLLYALTVIEQIDGGELRTRGLFIGDDHATFERAAELAYEVNFTHLDRAPQHVVAYLDPSEFKSTWLGNKAIYRSRMAIATGGRLTVLAPAVCEFGEDKQIDGLIRKYGYRTSAEVLQLVKDHPDLASNLSAAAHLIHGSSERRFEVIYAAGGLTREEVESVGYSYGDLAELTRRYNINELADGWNRDEDGSEFYFIRNPALGLWEAPK